MLKGQFLACLCLDPKDKLWDWSKQPDSTRLAMTIHKTTRGFFLLKETPKREREKERGTTVAEETDRFRPKERDGI